MIGYRGHLFIYLFAPLFVYLPVYLIRLLTDCCELGFFLLLLLDWGFFGRSFVFFLPSFLFPALPPTLLKLFCLPGSFQTPPVREGGRRGRNTSLPAGGGGPAQPRLPLCEGAGAARGRGGESPVPREGREVILERGRDATLQSQGKGRSFSFLTCPRSC